MRAVKALLISVRGSSVVLEKRMIGFSTFMIRLSFIRLKNRIVQAPKSRESRRPSSAASKKVVTMTIIEASEPLLSEVGKVSAEIRSMELGMNLSLSQKKRA